MKKVLIYTFFTLLTLKLMAQTEKQLSVSEIRQQTVLTEPLTLQKGYFKANAQFSYLVFSTSYYDGNWKKVPNYGYMSNSFAIPFSVNYGITNNLEMNISSNYEYEKVSESYKSIDYTKLTSNEQERNKITNGFNDISFGLSYSFFKGKTNLPEMEVGSYFTLPYGKTEPTSSDSGKTIYDATSFGCYELGLGYLVKKVFYPFSVSGSILYSYSFSSDVKLKYYDTAKSHVKHGDMLKSSIVFNYMLCDWISIGNSISYTWNGADEINNVKQAYNPVSYQYTPSLTFQIRNFRLTQGVSFYLAAKNCNTAPHAYISLAVKI